MPKDSNESPPAVSRSTSVPPATTEAPFSLAGDTALPPSSKRTLPPHPAESPAKKQSKWSSDEDDTIIALRGTGMKWEDISKRLPGRSAISCRLHYQNYLERRSEWDEEKKNKLARLYERFKPDMWSRVAEEMQIPWRTAEAMHWQLGEADIARRAGVIPFSLSSAPIDTNAPKSGRRGSVASNRARREPSQRLSQQQQPQHQQQQEPLPELAPKTLAYTTTEVPAFSTPAYSTPLRMPAPDNKRRSPPDLHRQSSRGKK
ncbi:MAG: hypothetical protein M1829_000073 [Trizodia sp. TS-e1964]|nr:MAG: hypothetical protein M1829_000073 [Trizodia sp. TS-e1964]